MLLVVCFVFFKQKTAYEMRISDWSSDVCSSDLSIGSAVSQVLACRFGGCIRSRARLHYSPALGVRDNDVFDDFYVERSGTLYQRECCNKVLIAGRRISPGVMVNEHGARGVNCNLPAEDWEESRRGGERGINN